MAPGRGKGRKPFYRPASNRAIAEAATNAAVAMFRAVGGAAGSAPGGDQKRPHGGDEKKPAPEKGDGPPPAKRVKSVAEMTASERRREAEIVAKRIDYHERKLGDLRGRHEELLAGLPDEEMEETPRPVAELEAENKALKAKLREMEEEEKKKQGSDPEREVKKEEAE